MLRSILEQCEIKEGGRWSPLSIVEAVTDRPSRARCPSCRGPVRAHKAGAGGSFRAHFEHRRAHKGCKWNTKFDGTSRRTRLMKSGYPSRIRTAGVDVNRPLRRLAPGKGTHIAHAESWAAPIVGGSHNAASTSSTHLELLRPAVSITGEANRFSLRSSCASKYVRGRFDLASHARPDPPCVP